MKQEIYENPEKNDLWQSIENTVRESVSKTIENPLRKLKRPQDEIAREVEKALENEKLFVKKIIDASKEISGNKVVLFDIDETLLVTKQEKGDNYVSVFRPSLFPVLKHLKEAGFKIGFLSSRSKEVMFSQLENPKELGPLKEWVDGNLVFSSDQYQTEDSDKFDESISKLADIVDVSKIQPADLFDIDIIGAQQKIAALRDVRSALPKNANVMVVDDFGYVKFLNKNSGLYGVDLYYEGGRFYIPFELRF